MLALPVGPSGLRYDEAFIGGCCSGERSGRWSTGCGELKLMSSESSQSTRRRHRDADRRRRRSKRRHRRSGPGIHPLAGAAFVALLVVSVVVVFFPQWLAQLRASGGGLLRNPEWMVIGLAVLLGVWLIAGVEDAVLIRWGLGKPPRLRRRGRRHASSSPLPGMPSTSDGGGAGTAVARPGVEGSTSQESAGSDSGDS